MLVLPTIPEKSALKTSVKHVKTTVRRHSIDAQFTQLPSNVLDRQYTVLNAAQRNVNTPLTNVNFKPSLRSKYRDFNLKGQSEEQQTTESRVRVNFSLDETNSRVGVRLPPINSHSRTSSNDDYVKLSDVKMRSAKIAIKQNVSLETTQAVRKSSKALDRESKLKQQQQEEELNVKKRYIDNKNEKMKRSLSHADYARRKRKKEKRNKASNEKNGGEDEDDYEYVDPKDQSEEVKQFISLVKRLQISEGQTPQPNSIREFPKQPRLLANLSIEGQYALMKTYEDTIANEILTMHPNLAVYVPRVLTSKFRKRLHQPKSLRFLNSRAELMNENNNNSRELSATPSIMQSMIKQNSFLQQPFPTMPEDPNFLEHQLTISQHLEIAQEILDLIRKSKGDYVTTPNLDKDLDVLRTYAAYVKIWTKYFHLR